MARRPGHLVTVVAAALVVGAVVELVLLGVLIWQIGPAWTIALLIAKGIVGYLLARRAGRRGWRQFRAAIDSGRPPGRDVSDAAVGLIGPVLILLAGVLGALVGAALLVPPVRRLAVGLVERVVERQVSPQVAGSVFGPRRVRVKRETGPAAAPRSAADPGPPLGPSAADDVVAGPAGSADPPRRDVPPQVIEGEVLPPR